ncbi:for [Symbiodinium natans]|uniref:For protein n=1 Tax=Symbiodinium natans TaxID=878477 RepID=A0A812JGE2_9DINO|nr:for [Symbiodinium natans]
MDYVSKVLIISRLPVLKRLANFQVCSISRALTSTEPWRPGEIVFDQGEDGGKFFIIMSGGVRVDVDGVLLRELGKGACFGERALLFDEKRSGKVTVTEPDTRFWVGTREVFEKFVTKNMRDDAWLEGAPTSVWCQDVELGTWMKLRAWCLSGKDSKA